MVARQVFMIWIHPIFRESVYLLLDHPEVEWVGITSDIETAITEILSLKPDTILIEEDANISSRLTRILENCSWDYRLMGINLTDNQLNLYHHEQQVLARSEDLLRLVLK